MATRWESVNVQCPFYLENDDFRIRCEGILPGTNLTTKFTGSKKRKDCMDFYCCGKWRTCPICQAVEKKYE